MMPLCFYLILITLSYKFYLVQSIHVASNDKVALLAFKSSISEDPFEALASWNESTNHCKWQGVTCSLKHTTRVVTLELYNLTLTGSIQPSLSNLSFLQNLNLASNNFQGMIPHELGSLSRLVHLNMGFNSLQGMIPRSLSRCSKIQVIIFQSNYLQGVVPSLYNLSSLRYLNLAQNYLAGRIPNSIGNLSSIVYIDLSINKLSGSIPSSLDNLRNLNTLFMISNSLQGIIPQSIGSLPSISTIGLTDNKLFGNVPPSIYNISTLTYLGISINKLIGTIPNDIGTTLPNLQTLIMCSNKFHGSIPMSLANVTGLSNVDFGNNSFSGKIPSNLGNLKGLQWLSLHGNQFNARDLGGWDFLDTLTNCTLLHTLSLGSNGLGGVLPKSVVNLSTKLERLTLENNELYGQIPEDIGNLVSINFLNMDANFLNGSIPTTIGTLSKLQELYLSNNKFSGTVPASIGNLNNLNILRLKNNLLDGGIPSKIGNCQALSGLDLSNNRLIGNIPKQLVSISSLTKFLDLSHNSFTVYLPMEVGRLENLVEMHISNNKLTGEIPSSIGQCQLLNTLHMDGNMFHGTIPSSMKNLRGIQDLDLSRNNLSGQIPEFFETFMLLKSLNLSFNNFEGELPTKGVFKNSNAISVIGNDKLCGADGRLNLQSCQNKTKKKENGSKRTRNIILVTSVSLCSLILTCWLVFWLYNKRRTKALLSNLNEDDNSLAVSYSDILKATEEFSSNNLIGMGSFGSVYRGTMKIDDEKKVVAVKVLNIEQKGASKSFMAECNTMKNIRHRNLVKLLTSCSTLDSRGNEFKVLVYEYMPNGSLEEWLYTKDEKLSLKQRLSMAIDVAHALDYLHNHHGSTPIVHSDLKPSNVLVDGGMTARVGDFGLAKFLSVNTEKSSTSSMGVKGTFGYFAPEYGMTGKVSTQGDIYSYGILLLEMFTALRPTDEKTIEGQNLHKFVKASLPKRVMEIIDPCLITEEYRAMGQVIKEILTSILAIGLLCSEESPKDRKLIKDGITELVAIRDWLIKNVPEDSRS